MKVWRFIYRSLAEKAQNVTFFFNKFNTFPNKFNTFSKAQNTPVTVKYYLHWYKIVLLQAEKDKPKPKAPNIVSSQSLHFSTLFGTFKELDLESLIT